MNKHLRTTATLLGGVAVGTAVVLAGTPNGATGSTAARRSGGPADRDDEARHPLEGGQVERYIDKARRGDVGDLFLGVGGPILDHATRKKVGSVTRRAHLVGRHNGTVTGRPRSVYRAATSTSTA